MAAYVVGCWKEGFDLPRSASAIHANSVAAGADAVAAALAAVEV